MTSFKETSTTVELGDLAPQLVWGADRARRRRPSPLTGEDGTSDAGKVDVYGPVTSSVPVRAPACPAVMGTVRGVPGVDVPVRLGALVRVVAASVTALAAPAGSAEPVGDRPRLGSQASSGVAHEVGSGHGIAEKVRSSTRSTEAPVV